MGRIVWQFHLDLTGNLMTLATKDQPCYQNVNIRLICEHISNHRGQLYN